ncbi:MAG: hypothetical protein RL650_2236 [Pseudomonadota bacterium]
MTYVLPRQDYFELIPSRSNNLQPVRDLLGCTPRALSGSDRILHGLNVFTSCVLVMKVALLNGELA